jgi:hypothetical protein
VVYVSIELWSLALQVNLTILGNCLVEVIQLCQFRFLGGSFVCCRYVSVSCRCCLSSVNAGSPRGLCCPRAAQVVPWSLLPFKIQGIIFRQQSTLSQSGFCSTSLLTAALH